MNSPETGRSLNRHGRVRDRLASLPERSHQRQNARPLGTTHMLACDSRILHRRNRHRAGRPRVGDPRTYAQLAAAYALTLRVPKKGNSLPGNKRRKRGVIELITLPHDLNCECSSFDTEERYLLQLAQDLASTSRTPCSRIVSYAISLQYRIRCLSSRDTAQYRVPRRSYMRDGTAYGSCPISYA